MHYLGIDIGSSATKTVAIDTGGNVLAGVAIQLGTGTKGVDEAVDETYQRSALKREDCLGTVATGYGRLTFKGADMQVSEITCHMRGIRSIFPEVKTIIDIGGQDLKAIQLDSKGGIAQFVMNDKCAAGTGRFLDVMSRVLGLSIEILGETDKEAAEILPISNTCTVFAESEVISRLAESRPIPDIVAGIHQSVARKAAGLALRIGVLPRVCLTGGVAQNKGIIAALEKELGHQLLIPQNPQLTGALGAALIALEKYS